MPRLIETITDARGHRFAFAILVGLLVGYIAASAAADAAWVKDELRLHVRSGPGNQFRIKRAITTGDRVQIVERGDGWTKVRMEDAEEGWVPMGFLQPEPPAAMRLAQSEAQTTEFRGQLDSISERASALEETNAELASRDQEQRSQIDILTRENLELRAGARWPEWITGAGILGAGMLMGAILHSITGRRSRPRIRL